MSQTTLGTVTVTNGSINVVGDTNTNWTGITTGQLFTILGSNVWYTVAAPATFVGGTHWEVTITPAYAGATASAQQYILHTSFTPVKNIPYPEQGDVNTASIFKKAMLVCEGLFSAFGFQSQTRQSLTIISTLSTGDLWGMEQVNASQTGDFSALRMLVSNIANAYWAVGKYTTATAFTEFLRVTQAGLLQLSVGLLAISPTAGIGYGTGAGGTVTQTGSRTTTVALSKVCGTITLFTATLAADTSVSFTFTNSAITAGDIVLLEHISGGTIGIYKATANNIGAGSCTVTVRNLSPSISASEAPVFRFVVIKASTT